MGWSEKHGLSPSYLDGPWLQVTPLFILSTGHSSVKRPMHRHAVNNEARDQVERVLCNTDSIS